MDVSCLKTNLFTHIGHVVALAHCPFQSLLLPFQAVNHALLRTIPNYFYAQITSSQQRD